MFFKGSRYEKVPTRQMTDASGRVVRYKAIRFIGEPPVTGNDQVDRDLAVTGHRVNSDERLDHIAWQHYRDAERFWRICDENRAQWPDDLLEEAQSSASRHRKSEMAKQISYALSINGRPAPAPVLNAVRQIQVEDHAEMADMLRLRLAVAVREDGSGWTLLDDDVFPRLTRVALSVTVGSGRAVPLIDAYVIEVDTKFSNAPGGSELTVTAMDPTVLMHLDEKVKAWPNMKDSDVASAIFSDPAYRFTSVVESTKWSRQEDDHTLMQHGTDIQFLQKLAGRNGFECFVELNDAGTAEGHFHPPRHDAQPQGTLTVNMGSATNVNAFRARFDMLGPTTAQAATLDPDTASAEKGQADEDSVSAGMGDQPAVPADRPRRVLLSGLAMTQASEVQRYAQALVDRSSWSIVADGEVNTVAYGGVLKAKRPVMVRGVGRQFSGRYYVEQVLHTIGGDGAYTQRFRLRRNAVGVTRRDTFRSDDAIAS